MILNIQEKLETARPKFCLENYNNYFLVISIPPKIILYLCDWKNWKNFYPKTNRRIKTYVRIILKSLFSSYQFFQVILRKISNKTETHRYIYESIRIKGCIFNQCYKPKTDPGIGRDFYLTRVWVVISREHSKSKKTLWNANNSLSLLQVCQVLLYSLCLHYIL